MSRFSAYAYNGDHDPDCQSNGNLPVDSTSGWHMYTLEWGSWGARVYADGAVFAEVPGKCVNAASATLKLHIWGCNGMYLVYIWHTFTKVIGFFA